MSVEQINLFACQGLMENLIVCLGVAVGFVLIVMIVHKFVK